MKSYHIRLAFNRVKCVLIWTRVGNLPQVLGEHDGFERVLGVCLAHRGTLVQHLDRRISLSDESYSTFQRLVTKSVLIVRRSR